jgi:hypothetical protein
MVVWKTNDECIIVSLKVPNVLTNALKFQNMMKDDMDLKVKILVSNFEACVACLRVQVLHDHLCKVY